jgi:hypothetical protein
MFPYFKCEDAQPHSQHSELCPRHLPFYNESTSEIPVGRTEYSLLLCHYAVYIIGHLHLLILHNSECLSYKTQ